MAGYAVSNDQGGSQQNLGSAYKTLLNVFGTSGALARGYLYEFNIGADGAPANNSLTWNVSRTTVDGSGATGITPSPLNLVYSAMLATGKVNYTGEPTYTASLWTMPLNQQSSYRWVSGREALSFPATAAAGLGIRAKSATYALTALAHSLWEE